MTPGKRCSFSNPLDSTLIQKAEVSNSFTYGLNKPSNFKEIINNLSLNNRKIIHK